MFEGSLGGQRLDEVSMFEDLEDLLKLKTNKAKPNQYESVLKRKPYLRFFMGQREAMQLFKSEGMYIMYM